jgi:hypothetical protein
MHAAASFAQRASGGNDRLRAGDGLGQADPANGECERQAMASMAAESAIGTSTRRRSLRLAAGQTLESRDIRRIAAAIGAGNLRASGMRGRAAMEAVPH